MNDKYPTVSFTKSRRAITGTLAKFQNPARTNIGHYISSIAAPSANDATTQPCSAYKKEEEDWNPERIIWQVSRSEDIKAWTSVSVECLSRYLCIRPIMCTTNKTFLQLYHNFQGRIISTLYPVQDQLANVIFFKYSYHVLDEVQFLEIWGMIAQLQHVFEQIIIIIESWPSKPATTLK